MTARVAVRHSRSNSAHATPMRRGSAVFLVVTMAAASLVTTCCGRAPRDGQVGAASESSLAPDLYPTPLPTAEFTRTLAGLEGRCKTLAAQRFPGSVGLGAGGTEAYGLVADASREHQTITPPYLPSDATSWEPAATCYVQTASTDSAAPPSFPSGCSSVEMVPLQMQLYLFASGRSGTIAEKQSGGVGAPAGTCVLTYGTLPTGTAAGR